MNWSRYAGLLAAALVLSACASGTHKVTSEQDEIIRAIVRPDLRLGQEATCPRDLALYCKSGGLSRDCHCVSPAALESSLHRTLGVSAW